MGLLNPLVGSVFSNVQKSNAIFRLSNCMARRGIHRVKEDLESPHPLRIPEGSRV